MNIPLRLACLGSNQIVEQAILRPAKMLGTPITLEVVCRHPDRHRELAAKYPICSSIRTIDDVLFDPAVDAIYIALPNALHFRTASQAIRAGKAVLVEKPCCIHLDEADQLKHLPEGCVLMEGLMVRHHPWQDWLRELVREQNRPILTINTFISFPLAEEKLARMSPVGEGGGVWYDTAPYWLQFVQSLGLNPREFQVQNVVATRRFDCDTIVTSRAGDTLVNIYASFKQPFAAIHELVLDGQKIYVENFLRPMVGSSPVRINVVSRWGEVLKKSIHAENYFQAQLEAFIRAIKGGTFHDATLHPRVQALAETGHKIASQIE